MHGDDLDLGMPLALEAGALRARGPRAAAGIGARCGERTGRRRTGGWITLVGPGRDLRPDVLRRRRARSLFGGSFVQDGLALFAKRLFLASAALSVLGSLALRQRHLRPPAARSITSRCSSRCSGMCVLASARELILLFVAFELMSIPLFLLTGFLKRDAVAPEAALKFFLVGTVSSAVIVYGMSFIYGATGSTTLDAIPAAHGRRRPAADARHGAAARGARLQDRGVPVPHVGAGHLRGGEHAVRRVAVGGAEGGRLRRHHPPLRRGRRSVVAGLDARRRRCWRA